MNTDQNNGAIKFSIAGLAASGAVFAFARIPAIHQFALANLTYLLLSALILAWIMIALKAKKLGSNNLGTMFSLVGDAIAAMIFASAAIANKSPLGSTDVVLLLLTTAAVVRLIVPGKIFGTGKIFNKDKESKDRWFLLRWLALCLAALFTFPGATGVQAMSGLLVTVGFALAANAAQKVLGSGFHDKATAAASGPDQVLRGSKLISATDLAAQIRARVSGTGK